MASLARTTSGDLDFSGHGLVIVTDPVQCAAWELEDRLGLAKGEWVYNQDEGVPYFVFLGVKNPSIPAITAMFRTIILGVQPIQAVDIKVTRDRARRAFTWSFTAYCQGNRTITGGSNPPFIVSPPGGSVN